MGDKKKKVTITEKKFPVQHIRAQTVPGTVNKDDRTVEVVFGTDNILKRRNWDGVYFEQLSFDPSHVRMGRLVDGAAPVLDNHRYYGSIKDSQIGRVVSARLEKGKGYAVLKLSKRESVEEIWQDIQDGIICNVSVGYNVHSFEVEVKDDEPNFYKAVDWEPMEVSFVPIPADYEATVREEIPEDAPYNIVSIRSFTKINTSMKKELKDQIRSLVKKAGLDTSFADQLIGRSATIKDAEKAIADEVKKRSDSPAGTPTPEPTPETDESRAENAPGTPTAEALEAAARTAVQNENARRLTVRNAATVAGFSAEVGVEMAERGLTVDQARAELFKKLETDGPQIRGQHRAELVGEGEVEKRRNAMSDALLHRNGFLLDETGKPLALPDNARQYRNSSLLELGVAALEAHGVDTRGMSKQEKARMILTSYGRGAMSTSDFPIILGNTVNRVLRAQYDLAPRTFQPFTRQVNASDFKEMTRAQLSSLMDGLEKVTEGGEYKRTKMTESAEKWKVEKYGRIVPITWETIINDDLDAFTRIPSAIAAEAAYKQSEIIYKILTGNPNMHDGTKLFHAQHGNLGTAGAINETTISEARKLMRKQTGLDGKKKLNLTAQYLIVSPDKETEAQKFLSAIVANQTVHANVFSGRYELIVEALLDGNAWYMAAMPSRIDTIEYGFLDGEELTTSQRESFDIDGMEVKVRMTFGAKAIDWRGLYKNAGA